MIVTVFLLDYLQDSPVIINSDRLLQLLFSLNHLYNLFLKEQGVMFAFSLAISTLSCPASCSHPFAALPMPFQDNEHSTSALCLCSDRVDSKCRQKNLKYLGSSMMLHCTHHAQSRHYQLISGFQQIGILNCLCWDSSKLHLNQYLRGMQVLM